MCHGRPLFAYGEDHTRESFLARVQSADVGALLAEHVGAECTDVTKLIRYAPLSSFFFLPRSGLVAL
jgi:hypothetical protein